MGYIGSSFPLFYHSPHFQLTPFRQKLRGQVATLKDELKGTKKEQAEKQKEVRPWG